MLVHCTLAAYSRPAEMPRNTTETHENEPCASERRGVGHHPTLCPHFRFFPESICQGYVASSHTYNKCTSALSKLSVPIKRVLDSFSSRAQKCSVSTSAPCESTVFAPFFMVSMVLSGGITGLHPSISIRGVRDLYMKEHRFTTQLAHVNIGRFGRTHILTHSSQTKADIRAIPCRQKYILSISIIQCLFPQ